MRQGKDASQAWSAPSETCLLIVESVQIEQFIESIYPTQDPRVISRLQGGQSGDPAKTGNDKEAAWDIAYMLGAVMLVLFFSTFILVRTSDDITSVKCIPPRSDRLTYTPDT